MTLIQKMTDSHKMGISERKEREKEQKRSLMLEAAEALILEKGLDNLNMTEVAHSIKANSFGS